MSDDPDFAARREKVRSALDELPGNYAEDSDGRNVFFDAVYDRANGDEAQIPWADLAPKDDLVSYLETHAGEGRRAIDVACGLGDNAEAMAAYGYQVTAFDVVEKAIEWAKKRFKNSDVSYQAADLFNPPSDWRQGFDLVHECYTLQALPEGMIEESTKAICDLVAPQGTLLIYTRMRDNGAAANGPPWPLQEQYLDLPAKNGLTKLSDKRFTVKRGDREIPHSFAIWERT